MLPEKLGREAKEGRRLRQARWQFKPQLDLKAALEYKLHSEPLPS